MGLAIGVDLGSANCLAAANGFVFYNQPSAIGVKNRSWVHGYEAERHSRAEPSHVVFNPKQFKNPKLLKKLRETKRLFPYPINRAPKGLRIALPSGRSTQDWTIPELEGLMLRGVKQEAKKTLDVTATDAVVAVPDNVSDDEIETMARKATLSGLNVKLTRELELAVIAHRLDKGLGNRLVAVVHVGQTLKMSLVRIKDRDMYVEEVVLNDEKLCGNYVDERLIQTYASDAKTATVDKIDYDKLFSEENSKTKPKKGTKKKGKVERDREIKLRRRLDEQRVQRRLLNSLNGGKKRVLTKSSSNIQVSLGQQNYNGKLLDEEYKRVCQEASRCIIDKVNEQFADEDLVSSDKYKKLDLFAAVVLGGLFNNPVVKASLLDCFRDVPTLHHKFPEQTIVLGGAKQCEEITRGGTIPIPPFAFSAPEEGSSA